MKKNGFTLIELLGVITVIGILCLITFPSIIEQIRLKETEIDEATQKIIESGVEIYLNYHETEYPKIPGETYCISLNNLVDDGILEEPIKNAKGNTLSLEIPIFVTVKSTSEFLMEYDSDECK